jgi:hypothetical protein
MIETTKDVRFCAANPAPNIRAMAHEFYRPATRPRAGRGTFILGLCGNAESGKTTVAEHLVAKYGESCGVVAMALADSLKIEVYDWLATLGFYWANTEMFNVLDPYAVPTPAWALRPTDAEKIAWINLNKPLLREILQKHGTELRRNFDDAYWTDRLLERVAEDGPAVAVIPDVRFSNEIDVCHAVAKVEMIGQVEDEKVAAHVSEREWRRHDFGPNVIRALPGDLVTLKRESEKVFERIVSRFHVQ